MIPISLICDKSVRTQNLTFLSYWYRKETFADALFNRYSVITQFAILAAGEQSYRRCTRRKLQHFKTFKSFYRVRQKELPDLGGA